MTQTVADRRRPIDRARMVAAARTGNMPTLIMVLYQLTGDERWLRPPYAPSRNYGLDPNDTGGLPEKVREEIAEAVADAVTAWAQGAPAKVDCPSPQQAARMLSVAMGEDVPLEYGRLAAAELGAQQPQPQPSPPAGARPSVIIVGAGVSGLALAIALQQAGIAHVIVERNEDVGGTWLRNAYPGCGVDIPSYLYSFSFFPRTWSAHFGKRDELVEYLRDVADHFGLRKNIRFGTEALGADYDEHAHRWTVRVRDPDGDEQQIVGDVLVTAVGLFGLQAADIAGQDKFAGTVVHSASWPADLDVRDRRVAVVGSGASAMQIVPAIVDKVAALTVFQRSPGWVAPAENYFEPMHSDAKWLFDHLPYYRQWYRLRLAWTWNDRVHPSLQVDPDWKHPERSVNAVNDAHRAYFTHYIRSELDGRPDLQEALIPAYPPYGKRILLDNGWYRALTRPHVALVNEPVACFTETGLRAASGAEYDADIAVLCTGFAVRRFLAPMQIRGRDAQELHARWGDDDATAYLGITVPGFPNLFLMYGPNVNPGGGSYMFVAECQARYIADAVRQMRDLGVEALECRSAVHDEYVRRVDAAHNAMVWTHPGMTNYFRNAAGRVVTNSPWRIVDYWDMTRHADLADFHTEPA
ncbi:flavin-containing monooxygenase [Mycobacterium shimoidei]|uniref:flavin-containing monooxygenase n=1 Tax=Mycobacterium shimoidei TaxID=29313 RepID=UPI00084909FD|nr:NAD(P)/FAD-dependent oxidoreductase [Mycobacterium shimoidei]ODR11292.1 monooxygenase [Mycobacterium shimoidei]ORW78158.1 monooxygenase [Mycobacterium shimoidei]